MNIGLEEEKLMRNIGERKRKEEKTGVRWKKE